MDLLKFNHTLPKTKHDFSSLDFNIELDSKYKELLNYAFENYINVTQNSNKKSINPPQILRDGSKHIIWSNFGNNCKSINREPKHVKEFIVSELSTNADIGQNDQLRITGRYNSNQIETIFKKYIKEFVMCSTCKSLETHLDKENRLTFKICNNCGSKLSIANIQHGFKNKKD